MRCGLRSSFRVSGSYLDATGQRRTESPVRLIPWVRHMESSKIQSLTAEFDSWIRGLDKAVSSADLLNQRTGEIDTAAMLRLLEVIRSNASRAAIREIYLKLADDINTLNLFLLAQPTGPSSRYRLYLSGKRFDHSGDETLFPGPAMLWTGDAPSSTLNELLDDACASLREPLSAVVMHQVPHHGSTSSLSLRWFNEIGEKWNNSNWPSSVISAGRSNLFSHPSPEIVWRIQCHVVTEGSPPFQASWARRKFRKTQSTS